MYFKIIIGFVSIVTEIVAKTAKFNLLFCFFICRLCIFKTLVWLSQQPINTSAANQYLVSFKILYYCAFRKYMLYVV